MEVGKTDGWRPADSAPGHKTAAVTRCVFDAFRPGQRDIVISLSPDLDAVFLKVLREGKAQS